MSWEGLAAGAYWCKDIAMSTVDEQHEYDDRFPTGEWKGF